MSEHEKPAAKDTVDLLHALMHGGRVTEARVDGVLAPIGLSSQKWFALKRLEEAGGALSLSQAAERLACAKSNVTQLVDRLGRDGLVQRVPDPFDRRSVYAVLTDEGRRRYRAGLRALGALEDLLALLLSPLEREQLRQTLDRLDAAAKSGPNQSSGPGGRSIDEPRPPTPGACGIRVNLASSVRTTP